MKKINISTKSIISYFLVLLLLISFSGCKTSVEDISSATSTPVYSNGLAEDVSSVEETTSTEVPSVASSENEQTVQSEEQISSEQPVSSQEAVSSEVPAISQSVTPDPSLITPTKSRHEVSDTDESFDITLSFVGDMILATNNYQNYAGSFNSYAAEQSPDYFLEKVRHVFEADDFTIANLENVLTDRQLSPVYKDYSPAFWFGSKSSNIDILSCSSVEGVLIANNHIKDYGTEGYNDTVDTITNAGILYGDANNVMYFEKGGFVISVICSGMWSEYQADSIVKMIKTAEQYSHYQVVIFHGGTEKIHEPEEWKKRAAHKLVDNGADLVVGGHPHVLQPREVYNDVEIVYSIGNFCYGGHRQPENRTVIYQMTLTVGRDLSLQASNSNIIPCYVYTSTYNNFQPAIVDDETVKNKILDFMDWKISSPV